MEDNVQENIFNTKYELRISKSETQNKYQGPNYKTTPTRCTNRKKGNIKNKFRFALWRFCGKSSGRGGLIFRI